MIFGFSNILRNSTPFYYVDLPSFQRDFASLKTLNHGTGPDISTTSFRGSSATYFDADGVLQTAGTNVPRFDHNPSTGASLGLLIEESRTNSIRNSQAGGAASGSAGTAPTNWPWTGSTGGLTRTITTGSAGGFSYLDVKFAGTPTSSFQIVLDAESASQVTAEAAQTWTMSAYIAIIAGSAPDCVIGIREAIADGTFVVSGQTNVVSSLTSSLQRFSHTRTLTDATTARVNGTIRVNVTSGVACDFTLRIAAPQLEQGAFPTSYIPTTTAAATRAADSAVVTPISSFYNGTEGTIYNEFSVPVLDGANTLRTISLFTESTGVLNRLQTGYRGTGAYHFSSNNNNVLEFSLEFGANMVANTIYKGSQAYKTGDHARTLNGGTVATSSAAFTPATRERLIFGGSAATHIRKIAYWPKRLTNTLLEQLTT